MWRLRLVDQLSERVNKFEILFLFQICSNFKGIKRYSHVVNQPFVVPG